MAMLQMQRIYIYALKKDRKPILELLQRRGVIEINDDIREDNIFLKTDTSNTRLNFEKNISLAKEAVEIINRYVPENKSMLSVLNGRKIVSLQDYASFKNKYEKVINSANHIVLSSKKIAENKAEILKLEAQSEILEPWTNLDIPLSFSGTKSTKSFIGTLPKEWTLDGLYEELAEYMPLNIDIISSSKDQTCIFVLCSKSNADRVYDALRAVEFSHPGIGTDKAPAEQLKEIKNKISEAHEGIDAAEKEIVNSEAVRDDLLFLQDYDRMRADKYEVIGQIVQSKNVLVISGYIPKRDADEIEDDLNKDFLVSVEFEDPSQEEDVPVLLKNNGFSAPLEGVLAGFSLPGKGEIDPTMVMSLFYYLLFGLMLSDAGYGAIMAGGCAFALIRYSKTMESPMRNTLKMYLFCGISTIFWGIMFGSYFGDIFDVIATTFFGAAKVPVIPPLWFFPVNKPMQMLAFSMVLGLLHLLTGLLMKLYQLLLQKDYKAILYDVVTWFSLIVSSTILLMSMKMIKDILGINMEIPSVVANIAGIIAIVASVGIVLTNGRESRNPFKRFLKGAYALYGITGYLSDVLSYSRLLALGLATGVIGSVINKMAAMVPGGVIKPLLFAIVILVGHSLNIAINALGAYVHTNRLQYVEFFGKFYEGGGRSFNPFGMKTKYYKIKEKM
jgi:V/A-type H+/Na+-transporting ATPase subunit I